MQTKKIISEIIIFLLLLSWSFTFVSKIFDFETFGRQIKGAYLLSVGGKLLPYVLQFVHLGIILMLLNKSWRRLGLITSMVVMVLYTGYLIYVLKLAPSVPCSCIALFNWMNWNDQLYFNFLILAINIIGLVMFSLKHSPHGTHIRPLSN